MLFKGKFDFLQIVPQMEALADICLEIGRTEGIKCVLQGITRPTHKNDEAKTYRHYRLPPFLHALSGMSQEIWRERQRKVGTMPFIDTFSLASHPKLMLSIANDNLHYYANDLYPNIMLQLHYAVIFRQLCQE